MTNDEVMEQYIALSPQQTLGKLKQPFVFPRVSLPLEVYL